MGGIQELSSDAQIKAELGFGFKAKEKLVLMELSFWPGLFGRLGQEMTGKPTGKKKIGLKFSQKPLACVHLYEPVALLLGNSAKDSTLRQEGDRGQFCGKGSAGLRADGMPGAF